VGFVLSKQGVHFFAFDIIQQAVDGRPLYDISTQKHQVVVGQLLVKSSGSGPSAQKSYGLYVAKLAGIPPDVVERTKTLLAGFEEEKEAAHPANQVQSGDQFAQSGQQAGQTVLDRLAQIDPLRTTPIDALLLVSELKQLAEGSEEE